MPTIKVQEFFKNLDIFSESIQFNASKQQVKKRTIFGSILTVIIIILTAIYFFYQSYLYFDGQMEPNVRQQSLVSDNVDVQLNSDMFAFGYYSLLQGKTLMELEEEQNKIYKVFLSYYVSSNNNKFQMIPLNIVKCQNPQLKGFYCFDFSQNPDLKLTNIADFTKLFSYLNLLTYNCQDTDQYKTIVPDNCADQQSIDQVDLSYGFFYKIKTSYFNTSSEVVQDQYKLIQSPSMQNQYIQEEVQIQKAITQVKKGFLIQQKEIYSFLNSFNYQTYTYSRSELTKNLSDKMLSLIIFKLDESIIYYNIQYPIFTQVLALCNSVLALLLLLGYFCRKMAQSFIRRDIFFILLQNLFLGTYLKVINSNNIVNFNEPVQEQQINQFHENQQTQTESEQEQESQHNILPESLTPKSSQIVFQQLLTSNREKIENDFIKEEYEQEQPNEIFESKTQDKQQNLKLNRVEKFQNSIQLEKKLRVFVPNAQKNESFYQQKSNVNVQQKGSNNIIIKDQSATQKNYRIFKKVNQLNQPGIQKSQIKNINLIKRQTDENLKILNNISIQQRLEKILFSNRLFKRKEFLKSVGFDQDAQDQLEKSIDDSLDFFKFYKEILFLKKAVMILLSKEQLAALNLAGIAIESIKPNQGNISASKLSDEINLNHLQEQFKIFQSKELQLEQIKFFLSRCENRQNLDVIDYRILSSIILNQSN
ncbi:AMP-binding enzyme family protein (macronuclear) [Tetrahymena thermophila SB210]|uniref:AMP-binding enzyme family protein n=1 Tax=Tetrahymena thermophila (strain SB210) TaxID=312017 RepID=I7MIK2_TETTS|nr:AMP-binding enzyme family protein [Tetrahymena thermophila SB210]EAR93780.2 AMP-binding enzyme family protein [Tetrahymena thermophila SB210]|eukprot:XP_001014025.2 AMP-binding enzyme family protein [Tetrahymena thermophila SB210]